MPREQLGVFTDGDGMSVMTRFTGDFKPLDYLDQQTTALPFHLLDRPATLVLGAGGGADVLQALYHHASHIDAVELNPQMVDLVRREFGEFTGRIYERPEVTLGVAEARSFVEASRRTSFSSRCSIPKRRPQPVCRRSAKVRCIQSRRSRPISII